MGIRLIVTWLSNCVALLVASTVIPSIGYGHKLGTLLLAGAILGVVNFLLRPVIILVTLPAVILSLGFALWWINALMLWLTSKLVDGFQVGGFFATLGGAIVVWLVNLALRTWMRPTGRQEKGAPVSRRM